MSLNLPPERKFVGNALLWRRVVAFVIDLLILNFIIQLSFSGLIKRLIPQGYDYSQVYSYLLSNTQIARSLEMLSLAAGVIVILYFTFIEKKLYQSIGKKVMHLYVVSTESNKIKFWQHLIRNLYFIPVFPLIVLWIVDPLFAIFTNKNQRLSEILSKTRVVQEFKY
tara:strand:- start:24913 stop:25413 length:501 start_codon:yes stop_codon:yes gene_type:complete